MKWIDALKKWNSQKGNSDAWCIPKKGTKEYDKVKGIMEGKPEAPAPPPPKMVMTRSAYNKAKQKAKAKFYQNLREMPVDIDPDMMM